ncbi:MAG: molybdate ABC transporter substrate-binding protein [Chloroflexi bacterium]|nr:molybdate ABC transporter substrate-binding protein [Chloroflexota bacterium]
MASRVIAWLTLSLLCLALGCGSRPLSGITLTVSAASDLRFAFQEIGEVFEQDTGIKVTFNFGSTGQLAQQIEQGAPVDVFAAASVSYVADLVQKGFIISETQALYARGSIILWTRGDSPLRIERLEDLLLPSVGRIAIANPAHAPYGMAARQAMQTAGVWDAVQPKLVLGENVNQAFQFVQTGNVDVGIIALSLAMITEGGRYIVIPQEMYNPIDQALGVVKATKHEREARTLAEFVNGSVGRPIMERYGFVVSQG